MSWLSSCSGFSLFFGQGFSHYVQGFCTVLFTIEYGNHTSRRTIFRLTDIAWKEGERHSVYPEGTAEILGSSTFFLSLPRFTASQNAEKIICDGGEWKWGSESSEIKTKEHKAFKKKKKNWRNAGKLGNPKSDIYIQNIYALPKVWLLAMRFFSLVSINCRCQADQSKKIWWITKAPNAQNQQPFPGAGSAVPLSLTSCPKFHYYLKWKQSIEMKSNTH